MRIISLLQPWATLAVIGAKRIETRSWNTSYRGPVLIHASKKMSKPQKDLVHTQPFWEALKNLEELPLGKIIGAVNTEAVSKTEDVDPIFLCNIKKYKNIDAWHIEKAFGDYSPGRFAWYLKDAVSFSHHLSYSGTLGLTHFDGRICMKCGCTDNDCRHCIEKTGKPCYWINSHLCSACYIPQTPSAALGFMLNDFCDAKA